jgi:hypothetical protein
MLTAVYFTDHSKDQNLGMHKYHHSNGNTPITKGENDEITG